MFTVWKALKTVLHRFKAVQSADNSSCHVLCYQTEGEWSRFLLVLNLWEISCNAPQIVVPGGLADAFSFVASNHVGVLCEGSEVVMAYEMASF